MISGVKDKRVLVVGLGASGRAATRLLSLEGAEVIANDHRPEIEGLAELEALPGVSVALGGHALPLLDGVELIVLSPGVPRLPILIEAESRGVPIVGEVELASWFIDATLVAITGTNGKSTVTSLIGEMVEAAGRERFLGGNLGTPLSELALMDEPPSLAIVELSSFQLERVDRFRADIAILLNLSDDHLDRYDDFGAYAAAKGAIFKNQREGDLAIVRSGDALSASLASVGRADVVRYLDPEGVHIAEGAIVDAESGLRVALDEIALLGRHNHENACAAILASHHLGIEPQAIARGLRNFVGLPHRMMRTEEIDGRVFVDDSKATNIGSTLAALEGLRDHQGSIVLIAGGRDKGGSYAPLGALIEEKVRAIVALGESRSLFVDAFGAMTKVLLAEGMEEAVSLAFASSEPGDLILLSPACSSLDQYRSYIERGEDFAERVRALKKGITR